MFSIIIGANTHSLHYILASRFQNRKSYHADFVHIVPFYFLDIIIGPFSIKFSLTIVIRNKSGDQEIVVAIEHHQRRKLNDHESHSFPCRMCGAPSCWNRSSACLNLELAAINIPR